MRINYAKRKCNNYIVLCAQAQIYFKLFNIQLTAFALALLLQRRQQQDGSANVCASVVVVVVIALSFWHTAHQRK